MTVDPFTRQRSGSSVFGGKKLCRVTERYTECIALIALSIAVLVGCQKSGETNKATLGEIFVTGPTGSVVRRAGAVIYLLTPEQNKEFMRLARQCELEEWQTYTNTQAAERAREETALQAIRNAPPHTNELVRIFRQKYPDYPQSDDEILLEFNRESPEYVQRFPDAVADLQRIQGIKAPKADLTPDELRALAEAYAPRPPGSMDTRADTLSNEMVRSLHLDDPRVKNAFQDHLTAVADAEGKFSVVLPHRVKVFAVAEDGGHGWHFKFVANGQKLILSSGNSR